MRDAISEAMINLKDYSVIWPTEIKNRKKCIPI